MAANSALTLAFIDDFTANGSNQMNAEVYKSSLCSQTQSVWWRLYARDFKQSLTEKHLPQTVKYENFVWLDEFHSDYF